MSKNLPTSHQDQGMQHPPSAYGIHEAFSSDAARRAWYHNEAPRQEWAGGGGLPSTFLQERPWRDVISPARDRRVRK